MPHTDRDRKPHAAAVDAWLRAAVEDAGRRGLPELRPLLEGLAKSTLALREADWLPKWGPR
jgi:hypothetical protein